MVEVRLCAFIGLDIFSHLATGYEQFKYTHFTKQKELISTNYD